MTTTKRHKDIPEIARLRRAFAAQDRELEKANKEFIKARDRFTSVREAYFDAKTELTIALANASRERKKRQP